MMAPAGDSVSCLRRGLAEANTVAVGFDEGGQPEIVMLDERGALVGHMALDFGKAGEIIQALGKLRMELIDRHRSHVVGHA